MLCLKLGDSLVPLEYALSNSLLNKYRALLPEPQSSVIEELNYDNPDSLELTSYYKKRELTFIISPSRIATPGASVPSFLELKILHHDTFLCSCQKDLSITHVKVILEEHSWCRVDSKATVDVQKEVRTLVLMDSLEQFKVHQNSFKSDGTNFALTVPAEVYDCKLPNIGPSFFSDPFSRTYKVRVEMSLLCETKTCSSKLSTLMSIDVALESHLSSLKPVFQPKKRDMLLFIERSPITPNVLLEVASLAASKVKKLSSHYLFHITTSIPRGDHVVGITAVYLSKVHRSTETSSSKTEFSCLERNALIMKPSGWSLTELKNDKYVDTGYFFNLSEFIFGIFPNPLERFPSLKEGVDLVTYSYRPVRNYPGATLDDLVTFKINVKKDKSVYLYKIKIKLVKQQVQVNPGGTNMIKTESWTLLSKLTSLRYGEGSFLIPGDVILCKVPYLEPSVYSNSLVIGFWILITVDCTVNKEKDIHLSNDFAIFTAKEDKNFLSITPPPYETDEKKKWLIIGQVRLYEEELPSN